MAISCKPTDYHEQAGYFSRLPEYSIECGTDYLAVKDAPALIGNSGPVKTILDLGCGTGLATRYLKRHFPDAVVIGADINQSMLMQAKSSDPQGIYLHLHQSGGVVHYSILPDTFDVVVCSFVFHENQKLNDLEHFLQSVSSLLRTNGLLLAWDTYRNLLKGSWVSVETLYPQAGEIQDGERYSVRLLPAGAVVSGSYWSPETVQQIVLNQCFQKTSVHFPVMEKGTGLAWKDETIMAPYYVLEAYK
ncbi:Trans-aconitate 2-methyltransferase [Aquicella siphonis]|uniref:Trans-aconitate 2-methyltransferase n=1 Tax=Aquicella siphonis TaxID=254247 RepID=A0A5E4PKB0_9COXI|nr:class I SAM-dependent methyltransferase [Aquicella siphonis]VVC76995.1 Trans-aconitate 2-methyltransferase [Aquicella siphonis]